MGCAHHTGILTLLISAALIAFGEIRNPVYMVLVVTSVFALTTNGTILLGIIRGNYRLSGGAIAHIGMALMLIGILYSSGFSRVISLNNSGMLISKEDVFTKDNNKENKENTLLWLNQPERMGPYQLTYRGRRIEARDVPGYLPSKDVTVIEGDFHGIAQRDIEQNGKLYHKKGDTLALYPENTYYEVEYREPNGKIFTLYPRLRLMSEWVCWLHPIFGTRLAAIRIPFVSSVPTQAQKTPGRKRKRIRLLLKTRFS
jgi:cytochrome c-type biogenesis protein CcmF